jgi:hypothetical protein
MSKPKIDSMKTTNKLVTIIFIIISSLGISSCCDDDRYDPIRIPSFDRDNVELHFAVKKTYTYKIEGGDGFYTVESDNDKVLTAEIIKEDNTAKLRINLLDTGFAKIIIVDQSGNSLLLKVQSKYKQNVFVVKGLNVSISGKLSDERKEALKEMALERIPLEPGDRYKFSYTDKDETKGFVRLYRGSSSKDYEEGTFEVVQQVIGEKGKSHAVFKLNALGKKYSFIHANSSSELFPSLAKNSPTRLHFLFIEDLTDALKKENELLEKVLAVQFVVVDNR